MIFAKPLFEPHVVTGRPHALQYGSVLNVLSLYCKLANIENKIQTQKGNTKLQALNFWSMRRRFLTRKTKICRELCLIGNIKTKLFCYFMEYFFVCLD